MSEPPKIKFQNWEFRLPASPMVRVGAGFALIAGGVLGFLPILGFWMIPLGVLMLSYDLPWARRLRRRVQAWWQRRRKGSSAQTRPPGAK